ncbi:hypothetical protein SAMN05444169_5546 [Bradyrhizobium erythrophlei]|uniref:Uncharacterized protein n=1 Tax=Bradyrhizobium erythrophlei TaxID=1437360 RepID=A0A1M5PX05_9BRAD|nr:hypothetical protein SAMN05444169_5546 [Bradyrhizobium erythrophlei]
MWDKGCRMPTQSADGRSRCFCGETIDIGGTENHVYAPPTWRMRDKHES